MMVEFTKSEMLYTDTELKQLMKEENTIQTDKTTKYGCAGLGT